MFYDSSIRTKGLNQESLDYLMYNDKLNEVSNHHQMRETKTNITSQLSQSLVPTIVGTIDVDTFPIRKIYQVTVNVNSINFVK